MNEIKNILKKVKDTLLKITYIPVALSLTLTVVLGIALAALFSVQPVKAQPVTGYYGPIPLVKSGNNWTNGLSSLFYTNVVKLDTRGGKDLFLEFKGAAMVAGSTTNVVFQLGRSATGIDATNSLGVGGDAALVGIERFATVTLPLNGTTIQTVCTNIPNNNGCPFVYILWATNAPNGANALTNYQVTGYIK